MLDKTDRTDRAADFGARGRGRLAAAARAFLAEYDAQRAAERDSHRFAVEVIERPHLAAASPSSRWFAALYDLCEPEPAARMVSSGEGTTRADALYALEDRAERRAWCAHTPEGRERRRAALRAIERAIEDADRGERGGPGR